MHGFTTCTASSYMYGPCHLCGPSTVKGYLTKVNDQLQLSLAPVLPMPDESPFFWKRLSSVYIRCQEACLPGVLELAAYTPATCRKGSAKGTPGSRGGPVQCVFLPGSGTRKHSCCASCLNSWSPVCTVTQPQKPVQEAVELPGMFSGGRCRMSGPWAAEDGNWSQSTPILQHLPY